MNILGSKTMRRRRFHRKRKKSILPFIVTMTLFIFMLRIARISIVMRRKILISRLTSLLWRLLLSIWTVGRVQGNSQSLEIGLADLNSQRSMLLRRYLKSLL